MRNDAIYVHQLRPIWVRTLRHHGGGAGQPKERSLPLVIC